ncbi:kinase-like protein [Laetiporus sulphureus 93-53]|uniref:non-specific serine/threonine protein kinase n=1 Tax=Laetiporus sulphureus 93-53 TaxID=1314785 RepID=A0A165GL66_9APHY|nr:kinase-like protein [Laetiporus sulphureus 93-53]KZT10504.1 kinase-like protein [Laetiporus sulphureus 93-53]
MFDESEPPSPSSALVALAPLDPEWQPILHVSNQVVLYNATSHALSVRTHSGSGLVRSRRGSRCPYCNRLLPTEHHAEQDAEGALNSEFEGEKMGSPRSRVPNYFQLLEVANESASRPATPQETRSIPGASTGTGSRQGVFRKESMAEGYFKAFFKEEGRLGMGANGSVFLCQHVLDGNTLGHFAVKKIAVGQSHSYLLNILREVRLLERLHHPNIITYHHTWLEMCQFSSFGPQVPTLHVLMQWAEGGSLDDFIESRLGRRANLPHVHAGKSASQTDFPASEASPSPDAGPQSRTARIRAFRQLQRAAPADRERLKRELGLSAGGAAIGKAPADWKAVHLLSAEEVRGLFGDIVSGLAFLHEKSILHLDLKPGNVLLTWDEGRLIPRAMLSDFGTSQDMLKSRARSGNTGTLEYSSPESLPSPSGVLSQVDSKSDMWSLGMILHKLLFFKLPYPHASDGMADDREDGKEIADALEREVQTYTGFRSSSALVTSFESRRLPPEYLLLLESLLNINPSARPSAERVLGALREGRLDPISPIPVRQGSLIPVPLRRMFHSAASLMSAPESELELQGSPALHAHVSQEPEGSNAPSPMAAPPEPEGAVYEKRVGKTPLLSIPISVIPPLTTNGVWTRTIQVGKKQVHVRIPRIVWLRTVKAAFLVVKVLSISHMCPDGALHPLITTIILALAVMDTWFDGLGPTLVLALLHVSLVKLACWGGRCCV